MVDMKGQALVLCQVNPVEPGDSKVSLLVPCFYPGDGCSVASRCLINYQGQWFIADWSLDGNNQRDAPLYGLPVMKPFWCGCFWEHRNNSALISRFEDWGKYASHNPYQGDADSTQ